MRWGTYSIVARDSLTGALGVAVQSNWFSVGQIVPWLEADIGAVATQSLPEPAFGPLALSVMRDGGDARDALRRCLAGDEGERYRQLAVVDARGGVAVYTGSGCIPNASDVSGDGFSCQANMMSGTGVPAAMAAAFVDSGTGDDPASLAERLLGALQAAEGAGGDLRGRQSAALVVASAGVEPWRRAVDLRVEDHTAPVDEMGRLLVLHRAYELADRADALAGEGRHVEAGELYEAAAVMAPGCDELQFWAGLGAATAGDLDAGIARVRELVERTDDRWLELLSRLGEDLAPSAAPVLAALRNEA